MHAYRSRGLNPEVVAKINRDISLTLQSPQAARTLCKRGTGSAARKLLAILPPRMADNLLGRHCSLTPAQSPHIDVPVVSLLHYTISHLEILEASQALHAKVAACAHIWGKAGKAIPGRGNPECRIPSSRGVQMHPGQTFNCFLADTEALPLAGNLPPSWPRRQLIILVWTKTEHMCALKRILPTASAT